MNNINKNHPTHKVWFSDNKTQIGDGVEVGVVWPRKGDKQGGILKWNLSPEILGNGVFRLIPNRPVKALVAKACTISFSQKLNETGKLGRAVQVASVDESGIIHWSISPEKLNGVLFVLENTQKKITHLSQNQSGGSV
ncbi:MAG: hypothetical protein ACI9SP_000726 [Arenicella sp.]|jgi:hypothetical protein